MRVLGIIPVRGGSKGISGKNKKALGGIPLLQHTATQALEADYLDTIVCTSDDDELLVLASRCGITQLIKRPDNLATDEATSLSVIEHAISFFETQDIYFDAICLLQVTSPFRSKGYIDEAIQTFQKSDSESLVSVVEVPHHYNPMWVFKQDGDNRLMLFSEQKNIITRRQELPKAFIRDGSIYITKTAVVKEKSSLFGDSISYIESNPKRYVNIDTEADWELAETIIKNGF
jgi:CMP-N-acetylneuraminic acid synthetase